MKVLAVCGFGVGSSMALKMQLEKVFKELGVTADLDNTDIMNAPGMGADAIFTSAEFAAQLEGNVACPIYAVKQFMNYQEVLETVKKYIETV